MTEEDEVPVVTEAEADALPVHAAMIRRTYEAAFMCTSLDEADRLRERLVGHVQLLIPVMRAVAPRMREDMRRLAEHVIHGATEALEMGPGVPREQLGRVYYLATAARALLTLHEHPSPLTEDEDEGQDEKTPAGMRR